MVIMKSSPFLLQPHQTPQSLHPLHCEGISLGYSSLSQSGGQATSKMSDRIQCFDEPFYFQFMQQQEKKTCQMITWCTKTSSFVSFLSTKKTTKR